MFQIATIAAFFHEWDDAADLVDRNKDITFSSASKSEDLSISGTFFHRGDGDLSDSRVRCKPVRRSCFDELIFDDII
jgi:hypothetical protein